ncbi:phosphoenolpyruvate--protein phosphotransferase [Corynebacterium sanguinis]|uniref:Phosphoenolpyruvate-protein phosphotransferase n=1 Tax=Corynebacterium sanguinis TaxID=2594913 RepID=A0A6C1TZ48_9CORY|nr:phosphoenolpyruvate--protein phosphotransferase [Corynebacterium sanguinis]MBA4503782.1 phosphoenolpyruvate--protein phosphotransferase [Corynebacterium sanguinis]MCT1411524.1 phosphoenolpyruvate--protein phosphotransferase [Corynebacterium sanguinis]MCT1413863.1 phosphoenolpyruvate--protein phosphotransferase [Corynebacterium sanguinis]MCT1463059.1 phosphoenolpyruvate--protein phosphotransferase [Corynebacterium sanguinis]MCT1492500.1 phosphoenolpyruvate--protein phosphotransferase [Coryne
MTDRSVLHGIGVSAGTASGPAAVVTPPTGVDEAEPPSVDPEADGQRVREVLEQVAASLRERAGLANSETSAAVLEATAALATDRGLIKGVARQLQKGSGPTRAIFDAVEVYAAKLRKLGGYMAERVTDLYDIRDRAIARLRGVAEPGVPALSRPSVLVAHDLAPAETATLDPALVRGIVTAGGGATSHTAILAAQLGIPAAVQVKGIDALLAGEGEVELAIDGGVGEVIVAPTPDDVAELEERSRRRAAALAGSSGEGATRDGHRVKLLANIGTAADAAQTAAADIEGSGLFRTEFLFLDREAAPSVEEQTATYAEVLRSFGTRRVVVRTLDAGADKPLSFADLGPEDNPALGRRGLRLSQAREDLLDAQLSALAAAHKLVPEADLWVMAPMVTTVEETQWFAEKTRAHGLPRVGVMVETPAAAVRAKHLLALVDFASIGTNDLSQYTMAADRMEGELAHLLNPWQPAVLSMVRATCRGGEATGKPVGVCGEAGGDPLLALVLVGLGVTSLSMAPSRVGAVRAALRSHDIDTCRQMANFAEDAPTAADARAAVLALADPVLRDLL